MKKLIVFVCAIAASAALQAAALTDFSGGPGRAAYMFSNFKTATGISYIEDAIAPAPGKIAKFVLSDKKEGSLFSRLDIVFQLKEGEAAAAKALAFDVRVNSKSTVGWVNYYLFGKKWATPYLLGPSGTWKNVKPGEWMHFEIATAKFMPFRGEITLEEGRQLCISFFCNGAGIIEVANIKLIEK